MSDDLRNYQAHDRLPDGRPVTIRAIRPEDKPLLLAGLQRQSPHAVYLRFFRYKDTLTDQELAYFTEVDFVNHVAIVASLEKDGVDYPVAVGRYIVSPDAPWPTAEVALSVDESCQGIGVGTTVLKHLLQIARGAGIRELVGMVLPENTLMLEIIDHSGLPVARKLNETGVLEVRLRL